MEALCTLFDEALTARGLRTRGAYLSSLRAFLSWLAADGIDPMELSPAEAQRYRSFLLGEEKPRSRGTVNNELARVRLFYRILEKRGLVLVNPFRGVEGLRTGRVLPKTILTVSEMGTLLAGFGIISPMDLLAKSVIEFLYGSGIRIGEAQHLSFLTSTKKRRRSRSRNLRSGTAGGSSPPPRRAFTPFAFTVSTRGRFPSRPLMPRPASRIRRARPAVSASA